MIEPEGPEGFNIADGFGALARAYAILAGKLHQEKVLDARDVASSLRVDSVQCASAGGYVRELADLVTKTVERLETQGHASLHPVGSHED